MHCEIKFIYHQSYLLLRVIKTCKVYPHHCFLWPIGFLRHGWTLELLCTIFLQSWWASPAVETFTWPPKTSLHPTSHTVEGWARLTSCCLTKIMRATMKSDSMAWWDSAWISVSHRHWLETLRDKHYILERSWSISQTISHGPSGQRQSSRL